MKKALAFFILVSSALSFIGCSNNSSTSPNVTTDCTYVGCVGSGGFIGGGGVATQVQYYDYNIDPYGYNTRGYMTISNTAAYRTFLKEAMGVCDTNVWGYTSGIADCNSWVGGSFTIQFAIGAGSTAPVIQFSAQPTPTYYSVNIGVNAGGAALNPLTLNGGTYSLINNSQGFELRSNGSSWNGGGLKLIQIQVDNGVLGASYFTYKLSYPYNGVSTTFATGTFRSY